MNVFADLLRREKRLGRPLNVAVVGAGFLGGGLIHELSRIRGMCPALVSNRTPEKAMEKLRSAGVPAASIVRCDDPESAERALREGLRVVSVEPALGAHLPSVDVVMEATGTMHIGTEVALEAIEHRKHVVEANPEVQVTVGAWLKAQADAAGVVYSDIDGDQPGIIMNLHAYCAGLGLEPVVAGNCKGVMKRYATPETQASFAAQAGISPWIATAAADGTKLNLEMALVANATGMRPGCVGMTGLETRLESLLGDFRRAGLLGGAPIVDFTLGIPSGVFVIARSSDPHLAREFRYLKMGDGPEYLFYRPYVLCAFEAPLTAAEAVLYGTATATPGPEVVSDVATYAKRPLRAGEKLEGIGGEKHYGQIVEVEEFRRENALPVGLAEYATLRTDVRKDGMVRYDDVVLEEDRTAVRLRRRIEELERRAEELERRPTP